MPDGRHEDANANNRAIASRHHLGKFFAQPNPLTLSPTPLRAPPSTETSAPFIHAAPAWHSHRWRGSKVSFRLAITLLNFGKPFLTDRSRRHPQFARTNDFENLPRMKSKRHLSQSQAGARQRATGLNRSICCDTVATEMVRFRALSCVLALDSRQPGRRTIVNVHAAMRHVCASFNISLLGFAPSASTTK